MKLTSRYLASATALLLSCGGSDTPPPQAAPMPPSIANKEPPKPAASAESAEGKAQQRFAQVSKELEKVGKGEAVDANWLKQELLAVLELDAEHNGARFNLAVLEAIAGNKAKALQLYQEIYEDDEDFAPAAENLAAAWVEKGETDKAIGVYRRLIEKDPKNVTSRLALARILAANKSYDEAINLARSALQQKGDAIEAFRVLASSYVAVGNTPMAQLIIGRGLKVNKNDAQLHYLLAQILLAQKELVGGVNKLKEVIKMDPKWLKVRGQLADIALSYRDFGNAAQQFEAIVKEEPKNRAALVGLAVSYKGMGRFEQSEKIYKELLGQNPKDPDALWNVAVLYHQHLNKYDDAISAYEQAKAVLPPNDEKVADIDKTVAQIKKQKNDIAAAKAREEREKKKLAAIEAACAAVREGKKADGAAIGNDQERIEVGWQLMVNAQAAIEQNGDVPGGESLVKCALEIIPDSQGAKVEACAPMRNMWTQILYNLQRLEEALANTGEALKCDPNNPDAQLIEQQLKEIIAAQKAAAAEAQGGAAAPAAAEPAPQEQPAKGKRKRR